MRLEYLAGTARLTAYVRDDVESAADGDEVFGKGLESRLRGDGRIDVVGRATRGTDALRLTRQLDPDVVLMDIAMPRMDGLTAARRLRKTCPHVCVFMLTGSDIVADRNRARDVGARYLRKDALDGLADLICGEVAQPGLANER